MNLKTKKKKGSSLLIVVAMMSILSILIISILAMTTSGYKLRVQANSRIENFYGADSGLEISEKLLHDYVKVAAEYSNKKVDANSSIVELKEKKKVFKETFIRFFQQGGKQADIVPTNLGRATLDPNYEYQKATQELSKKEHYRKFDRENIDITKSKLYYKVKGSNNWIIIDSIDAGDLTAGNSIGDYQNITHLRMYFESTYTDKGNERVVGVNFDVKIPKYGRELVNSDKAKAPKVFDFIFATDGNYELSLGNTADIYGDLWVKGRDIENLTVKNKYKSGVTIKSDLNLANISLNGGISTNGTLNIQNAMLSTDKAKNKDIYANNIVIDNALNTQMTTNFLASDIYVYNDFVSNGDKNVFFAKNYYGLNDFNDSENLSVEKIASNEMLTRSSAMIINSDDFGKAGGSKIDINGEAYILGMSYIDIGNGYQTGYSSMINQLTKPYTARNDNYTYRHIDSLQIIDGKVDGSNYNTKEKIDIAKAYNLQDGDGILAKGMTVGKTGKVSNIYNTGVVLANSAINIPNLPPQNEINTKKIKYATEVFNMGDNKGVTVDTFNNKVMKIDVNSSFNWSGVAAAANKEYLDATKITKIAGDGKGFADLELQKTINEIMLQAYYDPDGQPNLSAYGFANSVNGTQKPRILFNASGKKLVIKEVKDFTGDAISTTSDTIIYKMKTSTGTANKPSILVISNSDVNFVPLDIYSYMMVLGVGDINLNVTGGSKSSPAIIGNYAAPSDDSVPGYAKGQYNLTNELFKYILEEGDLMGDIGNDIFATGEIKEVKEAVEISSIIKKQDWKIIK